MLQSKKIRTEQLIDYTYFKELYRPYKERMAEAEFAMIIGIDYNGYYRIRRGDKARINKTQIDRVKYILNREKRYYTKEELEIIAHEYNTDIDTIIQYVLCSGKDENVEDYKRLLEEKGKIWIGKTKCSKTFASMYEETILKGAKEKANQICSKYNCKSLISDAASEAMSFILLQGGHIEKNFSDDTSKVRSIIIGSMSVHIKYMCLMHIKKAREYSYEVRYTSSRGEEKSFERQLEDKKANTEEQVLESMEPESPARRCIKLVLQNVEDGLETKEAIKKAAKTLGIKPAEAMKLLRNLYDGNEETEQHTGVEIGE